MVLFCTGLLGVLGNILTLIALICYESRRNSFNKLLIYMAVVDLLLILVFVNEFAVLNVFNMGQPNWYKVSFAYFIHPLKVHAFVSSRESGQV